MDVEAQIRKLIARVSSVVVRGIVSKVMDATGMQTVHITLRANDEATDIEHFQPFGLSFHPTVGSEGVVLSFGASQDNLVVLAVSDRDVRPTDAAEGEGGLYTPSGWKVFLEHPSGIVNIGEKSAKGWIPRDDRVDAMFNAVANALDTGAGAAVKQDGGSVALKNAATTLRQALVPTKSDMGKVT